MSSPPKHPFANSTSQIEVIYAENDRIDLEEETRLYEALRQSYNEQEDEVGRPTNFGGRKLTGLGAYYRYKSPGAEDYKTAAPRRVHILCRHLLG